MVTGIIGRKVGMTQVFDADGTVHPATVLKAGPCVVVQAKTAQTDGYEAVQLGLVEERPAKVGKPLAGHYKKASVPRRSDAFARTTDSQTRSDFTRPPKTSSLTANEPTFLFSLLTTSSCMATSCPSSVSRPGRP